MEAVVEQPDRSTMHLSELAGDPVLYQEAQRNAVASKTSPKGGERFIVVDIQPPFVYMRAPGGPDTIKIEHASTPILERPDLWLNQTIKVVYGTFQKPLSFRIIKPARTRIK